MSYTVQDEEWRDYNLTCKGKLFLKKKNEKKINMKRKKKILLWESCAFE